MKRLGQASSGSLPQQSVTPIEDRQTQRIGVTGPCGRNGATGVTGGSVFQRVRWKLLGLIDGIRDIFTAR